MASTINCRTTVFDLPTLKKIHGRPTFETLCTLLNEIKSNAYSVPSNFGKDADGHVGLFLDTTEYTAVVQVPYIRPPHPGPMFIPAGATLDVAMIFRDQHMEAVRAYRETINIEAALRQQIIQSVEPTYLRALQQNYQYNHSNSTFHLTLHI